MVKIETGLHIADIYTYIYICRRLKAILRFLSLISAYVCVYNQSLNNFYTNNSSLNHNTSLVNFMKSIYFIQLGNSFFFKSTKYPE